MGKVKQQDGRPLGSPQSWAKTPGTFISAQAHIDGADHAAVTMEQKWGVGRLRLLVTPELRDKFDRQRYLFNQAIWHGDLEAVRTQSARMVAAWYALDKAADQAGVPVLSPDVWEVRLSNGAAVAAIVKTDEDARSVVASGRCVVVYSLDEIARLLSHYPQVVEAKLTFPGATVEAVRRPTDPLERFHDTAAGLDDPIDDPISDLGA
jgi:hypothetical protein